MDLNPIYPRLSSGDIIKGTDLYLYHTSKTWYRLQETYTTSQLYHTSPPPPNYNYWDQPLPLPHPQSVVQFTRNIYYISPLPHLSPTLPNNNYWDQPLPLPHPQSVVQFTTNIYYISPLPPLPHLVLLKSLGSTSTSTTP